MRRTGRLAATAAIALLASAHVGWAQMPGIPNAPVMTGLGFSLAADYGKPNDSAGGGSAYALSAGLGFANFGLSASVGAWDPGNTLFGTANPVGSTTSIGGRLGMKLFGGGLNPVSVGLQAGASSTAEVGTGGKRRTVVTPGAWVRLSPPLFPLKPWGHAYYVGGTNVQHKEARLAVGADFNLLFGLGVHGAFDWGNEGGSYWGVGAHLNFRLPGIGVPGM